MKILFVAKSNSVHTARWIDQLQGTGWDIHFFPAEKPGDVDPGIRNLTLHGAGLWRPAGIDHSARVAGLWPLRRGAYRIERCLERWLPRWNDRAWHLARVVRRLKPDIVHSLEMQFAGYLTLRSWKRLNGRFPPWIYSSWGSDIFYFGRKPEHGPRVREVLAACDYYVADCHRDARLAKEAGFQGETLGVFPVGGGWNLADAQRFRQSPASARRVIAVKGYHDDNWAGRGLIALQAVHMCADALRDYEIVVYLADPCVRQVAKHVAAVSGLRVRILPVGPNEEVLRLMGQARAAIGLSVTDGSPCSLLEAMLMGALPIQSDTISTAEWIAHGENGLLVPPEDPHATAAAIRRAVADDAWVDRAAELNAKLAAERLDRQTVRREVLEMYSRVAARKPRGDYSGGQESGFRSQNESASEDI
jgi:glycosyltransferase involved in cell wall biosynthesis